MSYARIDSTLRNMPIVEPVVGIFLRMESNIEDWKIQMIEKEIAVGFFLEIEGAFDNTSFNIASEAAQAKELNP